MSPLPSLLATGARRAVARRGGALAALLLLACAGSGPSPSGAAAPADSAASAARARVVRRPDTPPRVVSTQPMRISVQRVARAGESMSPGAALGQPDVSYSVVVEADGRPNLSTLRIGGKDGIANRDAIQQWIASAQFAPALLDGVPVAAEFRVPR